MSPEVEPPPPPPPLAARDKIVRNAVDEAAMALLKFNPRLVVATLVMVYRAFRKDDRQFVDAIAGQDWEGVLPPFKFSASMFALLALLVWLIDMNSDGPQSISLVSRDLIPIPFCILALSIPMHFLLGMGRWSDGRVLGVADGILKVFQILLYGMSVWLLVFLVLFITVGLGDATGEQGWLIAGIVVGILGAAVVFIPLALALSSALGKLYGVNGFWAMMALYGAGVALIMVYSLITTGHLLPPDT